MSSAKIQFPHKHLAWYGVVFESTTHIYLSYNNPHSRYMIGCNSETLILLEKERLSSQNITEYAPVVKVLDAGSEVEVEGVQVCRAALYVTPCFQNGSYL